MKFRAGDRAVVRATGRPVTVIAASPDHALVRTAYGQWTYAHDELACPDPDTCPTPAT